MHTASLLLSLLPQLTPGPIYGPTAPTYGPPDRLLVARLREQAPHVLAPFEAAADTLQASVAFRHRASLELRSWLQSTHPQWLHVASYYDPASPHWPKDWSWPTTPLAHATMWLRLGKRCDARQIANHPDKTGRQIRERFIDDTTCYANALEHGPEGHLVLLAAAANSEAIPASRMLWLLDLRAAYPFFTCELATMPQAHALLRQLSKSDEEAIYRPALRMLDQAMPHGGASRELLEWVIPAAARLLANPNNRFSFDDNTGCLGGPYWRASSRDSLLVSIASQAGDATPVAALLAYCEPYLKAPTFRDATSDFAWQLMTQTAPQLEDQVKQRLRQIVAKHTPEDGHSKQLCERLLNALVGKPHVVVKLPEWKPGPATIEVDAAEVAHNLERIGKLARISSDDHQPLRLALHSTVAKQRIQALQLCHDILVWSPELEARIVIESSNEQVAVRTAAYRALATRDRAIWPCGWLVYEVMFDPAESLRALYGELTR